MQEVKDIIERVENLEGFKEWLKINYPEYSNKAFNNHTNLVWGATKETPKLAIIAEWIESNHYEVYGLLEDMDNDKCNPLLYTQLTPKGIEQALSIIGE